MTRLHETQHVSSIETAPEPSHEPESPDDDSSNALKEMLQRLHSALNSMSSVFCGLSEKMDIQQQEEMEHRFGGL
jgi:hypothetical protein